MLNWVKVSRKVLAAGVLLTALASSAAENAAAPCKVCVLDFTSIDVAGQQRFLDHRNRPIEIPEQSTLHSGDRLFVNRMMQGFIRLLDAKENAETRDANRKAQIEDNRFERAKALELYRTIVEGEARPMVIGADYFAAYLGQYPASFVNVDRNSVIARMNILTQEPDFPDDFTRKLAEKAGVTHIAYGTVADMRTKATSFKGYGIETRAITYELDVIVNLVDLTGNDSSYSGVYTAVLRDQERPSVVNYDNAIFQTLMKQALENAAEDFHHRRQKAEAGEK